MALRESDLHTQQPKLKVYNEKIYAMLLRLSRNKKDQDSLQNHREILESFAAAHNFKYDTIEYIVSGMKEDIKDRPDIQEVFNNIDRYKGILVYDISRIARDVGVGDSFKKMCKYHEIEVVTPYYKFDFSDPMQESMYEQQIQMAATEGRTIAKRHKDNKIVRSKRGEWVSSGSAYGYTRNDESRRLEIVESEAEVIRRIFDYHLEGLGSYKIRDILNAEGIPSPKGKHWNLPTVKRIIRNEVHKGTVVFMEKKTIMENGKIKKKLVNTHRCENAHPAIIEPKKWFAANTERIMRAEKFKNFREKPATKTGVCSLKDLVFCGICKRKHTVLLDKSCATGYVVKTCHNLDSDTGIKCDNSGIRIAYLEQDVFKRVQEKKKQLEAYLLTLEQNDNTEYKEKLLNRLEAIKVQLKDLEDQEDNLLMVIVAGKFPKEKTDKMKFNLDSKKLNLENEEKTVKAELKQLELVNEAEIVKAIIEKIDQLPNLEPEEQNEALKTFIRRIYYKREMPAEIKKLSTRNHARKFFPFEIEIEYIK
jgi:DNA invertase Pin-like site-specific DNA recombinase